METATSEIRFGAARLDLAQRRLLIDEEPARLGARAFDVLVALVERRDRAVGKNELFELVWPGVVVEENNLQVHISALRKLLGPQTIATIPGRGYRFTASLAESINDAARAIFSSSANAGGSSGATVWSERGSAGDQRLAAQTCADINRWPWWYRQDATGAGALRDGARAFCRRNLVG